MNPPKLIKPYVIRFAREVVRNALALPVYVPCQTERGAPNGECFDIVKVRVSAAGGDRVLGWSIWERPRVVIEAELHAVWRSPEVVLVDIAPNCRGVPMPRICFVEDPDRTYRCVPVDNVRRALRNDKDVQRWLALYAERFRVLSNGEGEDQPFVTVALSEILPVEREIARLGAKITKRYGP